MLSSFAFKFNLRRYTEDPVISITAKTVGKVQLTDSIKFDKLSIDAQAFLLDDGKYAVKVGRCRWNR